MPGSLSLMHICADYAWNKGERYKILNFGQGVPERHTRKWYAAFEQVQPWSWYLQVVPWIKVVGLLCKVVGHIVISNFMHQFSFIQPIKQSPWIKPTTLANCYRHSHQSLNNLFWKFSKRLSPTHEILIPFPQNCCMKTLTFFFSQSTKSSTLPWLLVSYHLTWKLQSSNPC